MSSLSQAYREAARARWRNCWRPHCGSRFSTRTQSYKACLSCAARVMLRGGARSAARAMRSYGPKRRSRAGRFWFLTGILPGMPADSGTPTGWLTELAARMVNVHCVCDAEVAAEHLVRRVRHPGHLDLARSYAGILESIRAVAMLGRLPVGTQVEVDTSQPLELEGVLRAIRSTLRSGT
ncbi:MAG: hypothetical protein JWP63_329 [Candidatus Solibacter sp.]|nr:hypothetical protein [Candidatus Solibacter sp.]